MSSLIFLLSCHWWHLLEGRCMAKLWRTENTEQETQDLFPFSLLSPPFSTEATSSWVYRRGNCRTHSSMPFELVFFITLVLSQWKNYVSFSPFLHGPYAQTVHAHFLFLHGKALRKTLTCFCYPDCLQSQLFLKAIHCPRSSEKNGLKPQVFCKSL